VPSTNSHSGILSQREGPLTRDYTHQLDKNVQTQPGRVLARMTHRISVIVRWPMVRMAPIVSEIIRWKVGSVNAIEKLMKSGSAADGIGNIMDSLPTILLCVVIKIDRGLCFSAVIFYPSTTPKNGKSRA